MPWRKPDFALFSLEGTLLEWAPKFAAVGYDRVGQFFEAEGEWS